MIKKGASGTLFRDKKRTKVTDLFIKVTDFLFCSFYVIVFQ